MNYKEIENIPMFFIVGRARSGTTLLQTMLDAHPSVIIPGESSVIMYLKNKYYCCTDWSDKTTGFFLEDALKEGKLKRFWKLDQEAVLKQLLSVPKASRNFTLFCKLLYMAYPSLFQQQELKLIGDKNPIYTLFIKDMEEMFPGSKFIHIVRDYRANIVSNRDAFSLKNIATLAHAWVYHNRKIEAAAKKNPDQFIILKYEDLVINPEKEMKQLCTFLKIDYLPSMLDFYVTINEYAGDKEKHTHKKHENLLKPVNTDKIEAWRNLMSESEILLAEYISGDKGLKYSYNRSLNQSNKGMLLKSIYGNLNNRLINTLIVTYYRAPFFIKTAAAKLSTKLMSWFKTTHFYNESDFAGQ